MMVAKSDNNRSFDAVIIGAGVIGASIALGLSRKGLRTLNIDMLGATGYGSTSFSSAIVRPFYSSVEGCALAHEARSRWLHWPDFLKTGGNGNYAKYRECGMLMLMASGDDEHFKPGLSSMKEVGVTVEHLTAAELGKRFPALELASFGPPKNPESPGFGTPNATPLSGAFFIPEAGYVNDPQLAAQNLQMAAEALGAEFIFNTRVVAINRSGEHVLGVTTSKDEDIEAPIVVNVAGPHSSKINSLAGIEDDMSFTTRASRHEVAQVPAPANFGLDRCACIVGDGDAGVYVRPETGRNLWIGSLDPDCDPKQYVDADDYNNCLTEQWTHQVWRAALRFPAQVIPNIARGVVGLYDTTPDWIPIYDKSSLPGFYMAVGTSGNQFKNAPVIGDLMADLIVACESGHDHDDDSVKFLLPGLNRTIDIGFFSRNRVLHSETSHTVLA